MTVNKKAWGIKMDKRITEVQEIYENGGFSIEHRFVDYDREMAASIMKMRNFDGCEELAQMILKPTRRHV